MKRVSFKHFFKRFVADIFFDGRLSKKSLFVFKVDLLFLIPCFIVMSLGISSLLVCVLTTEKLLGIPYLSLNVLNIAAFGLQSPLYIWCIARCVRRLHDIGKPGGYLLIPFVAQLLILFHFWIPPPSSWYALLLLKDLSLVMGLLFWGYFLFLVFQEGQPSLNRYGPVPNILKPQNCQEDSLSDGV